MCGFRGMCRFYPVCPVEVHMFKMTEFFYIGVDQYGCSYEGTVWHYTRRLAAGVLNEVFGNTSFVYFRLVA